MAANRTSRSFDPRNPGLKSETWATYSCFGRFSRDGVSRRSLVARTKEAAVCRLEGRAERPG
jgi:hypothetical protein